MHSHATGLLQDIQLMYLHSILTLSLVSVMNLRWRKFLLSHVTAADVEMILCHASQGLTNRSWGYSTISLQRWSDIMVLSHDNEWSHPYWYARVIHIFHILIQHWQDSHSPFSAATCMNVLFVRWFCQDVNYLCGWSEKRLRRLQFCHQESPDAFSFINPDLVVHGIHVIPAFTFGYTEELLGPSQARCRKDNMKDADWKYH